jgi:Domain of unknown function (DUF4468) with TBP-like fold
MRHLILFTAICATSVAATVLCGQSTDSIIPEKKMQSFLSNFGKDDKRKYYIQEVVRSDAQTKDQLFTALSTWMHEHFEDADSVLDAEDRAEGILVHRGWTYAGTTEDGSAAKMFYSIKITVRDGKYRFRLFHVEFDEASSDESTSGSSTLADKINDAYDEDGQIEPGAHYTFASEVLQSLVDTKESLMIDMELLADGVK